MNQGGGGKRSRGGGGGGQQQRRRRSGGGSSQGRQQTQMPKGPAMTALGESTYEAVFDHGNQGYGVWFDGVVRDDPMYKQYWKGTGTRPLYVRIEENQIVLTKELDRELPLMQQLEAAQDAAAEEDVPDVDAAIEEAVAEALAAAESAAAESTPGDGADGERVYSPEEAAALFAQSELTSPVSEAADPNLGAGATDAAPSEEEAPAAPKKRTTTRRRTTKTVAASEDSKESASDE